MDNTDGVVQSAPQGQVDASIQAPIAQQGETPSGAVGSTESAQTPQGKPEGQSTVGDGLILGKFKTQADLEKAYTEAQSKLTQVSTANAEMEKLFLPQQQDESSVSPNTQVQSEDGEDPMKPVIEALTPRLRDEVTRLIAPVVAKAELNDVLQKYGDRFTAVGKEVAELKRAKPYLSLEDAFIQVDYNNVKRTSFNQGVQKATQISEQQQKAQVESARPSGYRAPSIEDAFKDPNTPLEAIFEAAGPEYAPFAKISKERKPREGRL